MKPNDKSGKLPIEKRPFRILILSGSGRRQYNCPGVDSKSRSLMMMMADKLPIEWEIDYEDLGNVYGRSRIQSCNACVSTSMALCVWPCNCYEKKNKVEPDLMWDLDLYARLDLADAWAIIAPVNWYGPTSNLKLMFDRLVCMNGGNPKEDLIKHKDPEIAMALEKTPGWKDLSVNHLEGRTAAFFCYGDGGGDEMTPDGKPSVLNHPEYFPSAEEPFKNMRDAYAPLVWQCRYGGIEVPDALWKYVEFGKFEKYSENQSENMAKKPNLMKEFNDWVDNFQNFILKKGKVPPGKFRAFGYKAPGHKLRDAQLSLRMLKIGMGQAPEGSSPALQEKMNLNRDARIFYKKSEGELLRKSNSEKEV